jgi:hypothetical protein
MFSSLPIRAVVLAAVTAGMTALPGVSQQSTTRGFTVGAHIQGASLSVDGGDPDDGGGFGVRAGYGFNRRFTGYLEVDGVVFDVPNPDYGGYWGLAHVDLGVRFNFANSLRRWVPFLEGAFGAQALDVDRATVDGEVVDDLHISGGSASLGGGVSFFATETLAIEVLLKLSGGSFDKIRVGSVTRSGLDVEATSSRLKIGIAWWP